MKNSNILRARQASALRVNLFFVLFILALPYAAAHYLSSNAYGIGPQVYFEKEPPVAGEQSRMSILAVDPMTGFKLADLDIVHEKKMHVFIIGSDLEAFYHTHPDDFENGLSQQWQGIYSLDFTFPMAGTYAIATDYTTNGASYIFFTSLNVSGSSSLPSAVYDFSRLKTFGEYEIELKAPEKIIAGNETVFDYYIKKDGKEIRNLQMYLGSEIHMVAAKEDLSFVSHTHAYLPGHFLHAGRMPQRYSGPTIPARMAFNEHGNYVLFGQFMHDNKIITSRFMIKVIPSGAQKLEKTLNYLKLALLILAVFILFRKIRRGMAKQ